MAGRLRLMGDRDIAGAVGDGAVVVVGVATRVEEEVRDWRGRGAFFLGNDD